jgi:putative ABC transport system substrate-binding protein
MAETALIVDQLYYSARVGRLLALAAVLLLSPQLAVANVVVLGNAAEVDAKEAIEAARKTAPDFSHAEIDSADAAEQLRHADVVLAVGARALTMARTVAPETPIVYAMVPAADATPAKNITGVALEVPPFAQFASWKQIRFDGDRVGVIYDPRTSAAALADASKAAAALGITLVARPAVDAAAVQAALVDLAPKIDVLWMIPDRRLFSDGTARAVLAYTLSKRIPLLAFSDTLAQAGALVALSPDARDIGRRAARIALDLAGRVPHQRLPMPPPMSSPGALSVNAHTAELLGIEIPEMLLRKARKIYR